MYDCRKQSCMIEFRQQKEKIMKEALEFINKFDVQNLIGILIGVYLIVTKFTNKIEEQMAAQAARTDKLYEMFVDLLKESKKVKK